MSGEKNLSTIFHYPIIKIIDTTDSSEIIYAINKGFFEPIDITQNITDLTQENARSLISHSLQADVSSYDSLNSLLTLYNNGDFVLQYGLIILHNDKIWQGVQTPYSFKSLSIMPEFTDPSLYKTIDWCYVNTKTEQTADAIDDLTSDVASLDLKINNPNDTEELNQVVKLDIRDYDLSGFTLGLVVQKDDGGGGWTDEPTIFEYNDGKLINDFFQADLDYIWIKTSIAANTTHTYKLTDKINVYNVTSVFFQYDGFENLDNWTPSWTADAFTDGSGDYDGGIDAESTSGRVALVDCHNPVAHDSTLDIVELAGNEVTPNIESDGSYASSSEIEICYKTRYKDTVNISLNDVLIFPHADMPDTRTLACFTELRIHPETGNTHYHSKPRTIGHWWSAEHEQTVTDLTNSTGKVKIEYSAVDDLGYMQVNWVRSRMKDMGFVQMMPADAQILVKSEPTDWYLFDTTGSSSADSTTLDAAIAAGMPYKRCGLHIEKWKKFPSMNELNMTHYGSGRRLNYRN